MPGRMLRDFSALIFWGRCLSSSPPPFNHSPPPGLAIPASSEDNEQQHARGAQVKSSCFVRHYCIHSSPLTCPHRPCSSANRAPQRLGGAILPSKKRLHRLVTDRLRLRPPCTWGKKGSSSGSMATTALDDSSGEASSFVPVHRCCASSSPARLCFFLTLTAVDGDRVMMKGDKRGWSLRGVLICRVLNRYSRCHGLFVYIRSHITQIGRGQSKGCTGTKKRCEHLVKKTH